MIYLPQRVSISNFYGVGIYLHPRALTLTPKLYYIAYVKYERALI
jgi:hypothetical protein